MREWTPELAAGYVAGMIDGEGYVRDPERNGYSRMITISNTNQDIITATCDALDILGIKFGVSHQPPRGRHQAISHISIYGQTMLRLVEERVPIRAGYKIERLAGLLTNNRRSRHIVRDRLIKSELEEAYRTMTMKEMAPHFGVSLNSIIRAMKMYGIDRRTGDARSAVLWDRRRALYGATGRRPAHAG